MTIGPTGVDDTETETMPTIPPAGEKRVPLTWSMFGGPEFFLFALATAWGLVAMSKHIPRDGILHEVAISAVMLINAITAWLVQRARGAPSPVQEAVLDSKEQLITSQKHVIGTLSDCVRRNHPIPGPQGEQGIPGPVGPPGPATAVVAIPVPMAAPAEPSPK